jgi:pimeloyl-ACP methyl ester carboxylesterase
MVETLKAAAGSYWDEWRSIKCPILLVVVNDRENLGLAHRMVAEQPYASLIEISGAGDDLHLDNRAAWQSPPPLLERPRKRCLSDA